MNSQHTKKQEKAYHYISLSTCNINSVPEADAVSENDGDLDYTIGLDYNENCELI